MQKTKISKYFLSLAIFTTFTLFILIVQKSYSNLIGPIQQAKTSDLLKPINPVLDTDTLELIQSKEELIYVQPPEVTPIISPVSTQSSQLSSEQL